MANDGRFVVLPMTAVMGTRFDTFHAAETHAGKKVEVDGLPHVIVCIEGEARRRLVPNVDVIRFDAPDAAATRTAEPVSRELLRCSGVEPSAPLPSGMTASIGLVCGAPVEPHPSALPKSTVEPREFQRRPAPEIDPALQVEQNTESEPSAPLPAQISAA